MKLVIFNKYVSIKEIALSLILGISAFCFSVIMLFHECEFDGYKYLFVLPLVFGVMCFVCGNLFSRILESPVILILFATYYVRMCLSPFLYVISGYPSFFGVQVDSSFYYQATFLLLLETILVFLVLKFLFCKKNTSNNTVIRDATVKINVTILSSIVLILFLFVLFVYLAVPELQETNILLFKADFSTLANINYDNESIVARGTAQRYLFSLWSFLWPIVRIVAAPLFISFFKKHIKNTYIALFFSSISLVIPYLFLGGDNISPFIGAILGIFVIRYLYGKKSRFFIFLLLLIFVSLLIIVSVSKVSLIGEWRKSSGITAISQSLNAYFPGIDNYAITLSLSKSNYFEHLFFDFYYALPFKETLFGLNGSRLNDLFNETVSLTGCITPFSSQIAYYLTGFGSLVVVALFVRKACLLESKASNSNNFWRYFLYLFLSFSICFSISVYSFSIFVRNIVCIYIPIKILVFIGVKKQYVIKRKA